MSSPLRSRSHDRVKGKDESIHVTGGADVALTQTSPRVKNSPLKETSPASGKEMYLQYCASCHGRDGKGDSPAASALRFCDSPAGRIRWNSFPCHRCAGRPSIFIVQIFDDMVAINM